MMANTKGRWIYRGLMVFFAFTIACLYLSVVRGALGYGEVFIRYILYLEALVAIPVFIYGRSHHSHKLFNNSRSWGLVITIYLGFEVINSLLLNGGEGELLADGVFWLFFLGMYYMGASEEFWKYILSYSLIILVVTMVMSAIELTTMNVSYLSLRGQRDASSYVYNIQLGFESVIILLAYYTLTKQKKATIVAAVAFAFYFMLQIFFQKRLPLFRMTMATLLFLWLINRSLSFSKTAKTTAIIIGVLIALFSFVPDEYYQATYDRFFSGGSVMKTTESDSRYLIAEKAIKVTSENPWTFLFGNGLGSYLEGNFYGKQVQVKGRSVDGIGVIEIGFATLFMRYGVIFVILMYYKLFKVLLYRRKYAGNHLAMSCWLYLFVFTVMSMIGESFPYVNTPYHTLMVAASLGYLSSSSSRKNNEVHLLSIRSL